VRWSRGTDYSVSSQAATSYGLYTNYTPTSAINNYSGLVGMVFTNLTAGVSVTHLGRWKISGNSQIHTNYLVRHSDRALMASNVVNMASGSVGQFNYDTVTPVSLAANTKYMILTSEINGGDQWYDAANGSGAVLSTGTYQGATYGTTIGNAGEITFARPYGPTDMKYTLP
jgi:hypothetical protein